MAVHRGAAGPVVAVRVPAVAGRGPEGKPPGALLPAQRGECRFGALPLLGVIGGIEAVRPEVAVLPSGLRLEVSCPPAVEGSAHVGVVI